MIDNLYELDILEEVLKFSHPSFDARSHPLDATPIEESDEAEPETHVEDAVKFNPQRLSEALCSRAKAVMMDPFVVASPFADRATQQGLYYSGGKKYVSFVFTTLHLCSLCVQGPSYYLMDQLELTLACFRDDVTCLIGVVGEMEASEVCVTQHRTREPYRLTTQLQDRR